MQFFLITEPATHKRDGCGCQVYCKVDYGNLKACLVCDRTGHLRRRTEVVVKS